MQQKKRIVNVDHSFFFRNQISHFFMGLHRIQLVNNFEQQSVHLSKKLNIYPHIYKKKTLQFPSNFRSLYPKHPFLRKNDIYASEMVCRAQN